MSVSTQNTRNSVADSVEEIENISILSNEYDENFFNHINKETDLMKEFLKIYNQKNKKMTPDVHMKYLELKNNLTSNDKTKISSFNKFSSKFDNKLIQRENKFHQTYKEMKSKFKDVKKEWSKPKKTDDEIDDEVKLMAFELIEEYRKLQQKIEENDKLQTEFDTFKTTHHYTDVHYQKLQKSFDFIEDRHLALMNQEATRFHQELSNLRNEKDWILLRNSKVLDSLTKYFKTADSSLLQVALENVKEIDEKYFPQNQQSTGNNQQE